MTGARRDSGRQRPTELPRRHGSPAGLRAPARRVAGLLAVALLLAAPVRAQRGWSDWGQVGLPTAVPWVPHYELEYVSPQMHRWYSPANLLESYGRPWYVGDTRQAQEQYTRYVNQALSGDVWYDDFGRRLPQGWLVYNWEQQQPQRNGSIIERGSVLGSLVIASDRAQNTSARLMVGSRIHTPFTPLTFNQGAFSGVRMDYATNWYEGSFIFSRVSAPDPGTRTNFTHLIGDHTELLLGGRGRLGLTYVNAHNAQSQVSLTYGNPLYGTLTAVQNQSLQKLWVRVRDDSPGDGVGGAMLFRYDLVLTDTSGTEYRARDLGLLPKVEGGRQRSGALVADGSETIVLEYDLAGLNYEGLQTGDLKAARVELVVADDYRVELASNLQSNGDRLNPEIVFLPYARARGNVQDNSNTKVLELDYGLPTALELLGANWDLSEWHGLSLQGETVLNRQHRMYPSVDAKHLHRASTLAYATYGIAAYNRYPWAAFVEAFSLEDAYSTSYWLCRTNGEIRYKATIPEVYEFVSDDDDQNGTPEWTRLMSSGTPEVWPGYDENGDFIYDSNQNRNLYPDYEEPFLRFRSDRPEFLFGLDLNHNGTVDRFENDNLPDYPYKKDHEGYNAYLRANLGPDASLAVGRQRFGLLSGDGRTRSVYLLGVWTRVLDRGKVRLADFGARVHDDIPDDLEQWVQPIGAVGRMRAVPDPLPARNTWRNTLYGDWEQQVGEGGRLLQRAKWDLFWQRSPRADLIAREERRASGFLGVIDKAEWSIPVGMAVVEPRWKSEFRWDRPLASRQSEAVSLEQTAFLLWTQPLMAEKTRVAYYAHYGRQIFKTELQLGLELGRFWMLRGEREEIDEDYTGRTLVAQLTNRVAYLGYVLVTRLGAQWQWRDFAHQEDQRSSLIFVTMHAGLK